ncbi:MAG: DUF2784 domain-containing protein [Pseudomonadota bacterium]
MNWIARPAFWADVILVIHALIVAFVIAGLMLILLGGWCQWAWVRNFWFRVIHLATIVFVVVQTWLGRLCPLTIWERELRLAAGQRVSDQSFIEHWVAELLYWNLPWWVFVAAYSGFGAAVFWTWWRLPPTWPRHSRSGGP